MFLPHAILFLAFSCSYPFGNWLVMDMLKSTEIRGRFVDKDSSLTFFQLGSYMLQELMLCTDCNVPHIKWAKNT